MKRLICFDLDGTLTQHRSPLEDDKKELLDRLQEKYKVIMVGAGAAKRIYTQMGEYPIDIIANYGMEESKMVDGRFTVVRQITTAPDKEYFLEKAEYLRQKYGYTHYKGESVEFHATGMVTLPLLGTKADVADKIAFDPTREKRRVLYPEVLELFPDYTVYIGGSSSFDFTEKKYNKYDAIMAYAKENGYKKEEILYVGDDFGDGGGDSHIRIYGMDHIEISDYQTVAEKLKFLL
ncbi:MAG: HAD-IIB family hydrolase [Clostridia bacterium]|nr:HAD-IIB family hydrolase [Clostridia bacterium]MBQ4065898.1 HAD-IIB family hydrolase [Clostridia bacterium]